MNNVLNNVLMDDLQNLFFHSEAYLMVEKLYEKIALLIVDQSELIIRLFLLLIYRAKIKDKFHQCFLDKKQSLLGN